MLDYFQTHVQPASDELTKLLEQEIKINLQAIVASREPSDEELGW